MDNNLQIHYKYLKLYDWIISNKIITFSKFQWKILSGNPNAIFYFRFTKIKTPYKFFINEKFIIYWNKIKIKLIGCIYQEIQMQFFIFVLRK
jgi:hypothetical protein